MLKRWWLSREAEASDGEPHLFLGAPSASGVDPFVAPEKRPVLVAFDF